MRDGSTAIRGPEQFQGNRQRASFNPCRSKPTAWVCGMSMRQLVAAGSSSGAACRVQTMLRFARKQRRQHDDDHRTLGGFLIHRGVYRLLRLSRPDRQAVLLTGLAAGRFGFVVAAACCGDDATPRVRNRRATEPAPKKEPPHRVHVGWLPRMIAGPLQ